MFRRAIVVLISILSCCALICVGFSSWSFMEELREISDASSGNLSSENVILSDEYVFADASKIQEKFTVTQYGFSTGSDPYKTSFPVPFTIHVKKCQDLAGKGKSLTVQVTLRFMDNRELSELFNGKDTITFAFDGADVTLKSTDRAFIAEFTLHTDSLTPDNTVEDTVTKDGIFSFNLNKAVYDQMYHALDINNETENKEEKIRNPFVIVVSVINTPTP